jgi:hypothetical protein
VGGAEVANGPAIGAISAASNGTYECKDDPHRYKDYVFYKLYRSLLHFGDSSVR